MLELDGVEITNGSFALRAELTVTPGITAVIGPSGAGKSTLLGAVAGFTPVTAGRVLWAGGEITGQEPGVRPVASLFQDQNLFGHLTLTQNLGLALKPSLRLSQAAREAVEAGLADVGLAGLGGRKPGELSGGQQSRAALARLLLQERPIALLDEPFAALGPGLKAEMLALAAEKLTARNITALFVTHDPADAQTVAAQTILVADGHAAPPQPTQALFANPPAALKAYLG